jgi:glucose-6-phosphate isomerase
MDEIYHLQLLTYLETVSYSVIVISKSGTTHEPKAAFDMIQAHCEDKYKDSKDRIVAITDASKGLLLQPAKDKGYETFVVPDDVGGRYSVFTPVGLLPLAVGGYDIRALRSGVKIAMKEVYTEKSPAVQYALQRFEAYKNQGKAIECFVTYEPRLAGLGGRWQQLFGESDGKDGKGLFPACLQYSTDLHSMGQYMQDGPRHLLETMIIVAPMSNSILSRSQDACIAGTTEAHEEGGVPVLQWLLTDESPETIGQFLYTMMVACALSGYLLGVNPFDQPGVEAYKNAMKKKMK